MKEITKVVTVQETYIDILPDDSVEMIEEDVMNFKKYCEKRWRAESTADDVVANVQLFIRDLDEKENDGGRMTREQAIAELEAIAESTVWADRKKAAEMATEALQKCKTGRWIVEEIGLRRYAMKCSVCGIILHEGYNFDSAQEYKEYIDGLGCYDKFCHECGAKMEVDE